MYVYIYIYIYVCMYVCVYIYIYIYICCGYPLFSGAPLRCSGEITVSFQNLGALLKRICPFTKGAYFLH